MPLKILLGLVGLILFGLIVYWLKPILTPFVLGFLLAYLGRPGVAWLQHIGLGQTLSALLILLLLLLSLVVVFLLLIPLAQMQFAWLATHLPDLIQWLQQQTKVLSQAYQWQWNVESLSHLASNYWQDVGTALDYLYDWLVAGGSAFFTLLAVLLLTPLVSFYLLRDWNLLFNNLNDLLPENIKQATGLLFKETDKVFAAFIRGQLMIMLILATLYSVGFYLVGLELALILGVLTGLLSFLPYLGLLIGFALTIIAALLQFGLEGYPLMSIALLFVGAQLLEAFFLTPKLLGNQLGLHPLAIIFAVITGGQLFGFLGVLLALPIASLLVALCHARRTKTA